MSLDFDLPRPRNVRVVPDVEIDGVTYTDNGRAGWTIKQTDEHLIDVLPMLFNMRVVMTPRWCLSTWDHGWCYTGNGILAPFLAALAWDPDLEPEPPGYFKRACCMRRLSRRHGPLSR